MSTPLLGKRLFKDDQKVLKEKFEEVGLKDRTMGINTLNGKLRDMKSNYEIVSKKIDTKNFRGTVWIIQYTTQKM